MKTRYFIDTEFIEDGKTIDLISIGIVSEDGRELYLISSEYEYTKASQWVKDNVILPMYKEYTVYGGKSTVKDFHKEIGCTKRVMRSLIKNFTLDTSPEFWAYFADYDWVAFCQIFGTMMDLPDSYPQFCLDLKQEMYINNIIKLPDPVGEHNALIDARWNKKMYDHIQLNKR